MMPACLLSAALKSVPYIRVLYLHFSSFLLLSDIMWSKFGIFVLSLLLIYFLVMALILM